MITRDMLIGEILKERKDSPQILMSFGMACVGCPSSQMESLEQAAAVHGLDVEEILVALNK